MVLRSRRTNLRFNRSLLHGIGGSTGVDPLVAPTSASIGHCYQSFFAGFRVATDSSHQPPLQSVTATTIGNRAKPKQWCRTNLRFNRSLLQNRGQEGEKRVVVSHQPPLQSVTATPASSAQPDLVTSRTNLLFNRSLLPCPISTKQNTR